MTAIHNNSSVYDRMVTWYASDVSPCLTKIKEGVRSFDKKYVELTDRLCGNHLKVAAIARYAIAFIAGVALASSLLIVGISLAATGGSLLLSAAAAAAAAIPFFLSTYLMVREVNHIVVLNAKERGDTVLATREGVLIFIDRNAPRAFIEELTARLGGAQVL
jgi:hypothetical protein